MPLRRAAATQSRAGHDLVQVVDDRRLDEPVIAEALGDFLDLLLRMAARVPRPWPQIVDMRMFKLKTVHQTTLSLLGGEKDRRKRAHSARRVIATAGNARLKGRRKWRPCAGLTGGAFLGRAAADAASESLLALNAADCR